MTRLIKVNVLENGEFFESHTYSKGQFEAVPYFWDMVMQCGNSPSYEGKTVIISLTEKARVLLTITIASPSCC